MKLNVILSTMIGILFVIVLINSGNKKDLTNIQREISKENIELKSISKTRDKWKTDKLQKQQLEALFNDPNLKDKIDFRKTSSSSYKVRVKDLKKDDLKKITKKVLENPYIVTTLKVIKIDEYSSELELGVEY